MVDTPDRIARLEHRAAVAGAAAVTAYFLWYAAGGLGAHFSPDDMQNLHIYWNAGWRASLDAIVRFWSTFYRPLGAIFYLPLYDLAHFNVVPYRAVALLLVILNSVIVWRIVRVLTRDRWTTWVALAIWQFHQALFLVYRSSAIVYDILCLLFYALGLALYVGPRARGAFLSGSRLVAIAGCYVLALNAKEMAVTLPVTLTLLELIVFRRGASGRTTARALLPAAIMAAVAMVYVAGKLLGANSLTESAAYRPDLSWTALSNSIVWYTSQLIYRESNPVSLSVALGIWAAMIGCAVVLRSRLAMFGLAFAVVALLPVAFIDRRQAFVWYLPMTGLAIWFGCVAEPFFRRLQAARWAAPLVIALALFPPHAVRREHAGLLGAQSITWNFLQQIRDSKLQLPRGAAVLVKDEPFNGYWDVYFILRLYFDDPQLQVAFSSPGNQQVQGDVRPAYDVVLRVENGRLIREEPGPAEAVR